MATSTIDIRLAGRRFGILENACMLALIAALSTLKSGEGFSSDET
jgi:hypothetical protein